ncbi:MAG: PilT/PilU family type 4a pilus ATPase [Candidatus Omnitrophica bacterium]|nr:PilT/PilU family type 4a pilus ATPase [Candidatus Omnitrophota bacterium]
MNDSKINIRENKRQFTRLKSEFILKCKVVDEKEAGLTIATARDLSPAGIFFESKHLYNLNTVLEIELNLPTLAKIVKVLAKVSRIEELEKKDTYGIGAIFLKITSKDKEALIDFIKRLDINLLLEEGIKRGASDLHLSIHHAPHFRINGVLEALPGEPLEPEDLEIMIFNMLNPRQKEVFQKELELDFSYTAPGVGRIRANIHLQRGNIEAAFRIIPPGIRSVKELGLPPVVTDLARQKEGLVLVTGPSGSGKSTSLAAMIDIINTERKAVIVSIEDPIEYVFEVKKSIIKQREVSYDTRSFASALKHIFRQNPDVVFIGELRDRESITTALSCAEAGFFVLGTLHTIDSTHAISRMVESFPHEQQAQVKILLSECLRGVIAQKLLPRKDEKGLVVATEVLINSGAVRNLIRSGDTNQILSVIQMSKQYKMHTMNNSIMELYEKGIIDEKAAQETLVSMVNMVFYYQARDYRNKKLSGKIEAINKETAIQKLQEKGLVVISLKEVI